MISETAQRRHRMMSSTAYDAGSRSSVELGAYHPAQRSPDVALLESRDKVDARLRDMERNSGLMVAAVDRKMDSVVGADMRPEIRPNWRVLGITAAQARELGRNIEARWEVYANDPNRMLDAGRRMSFGMMARVLYWHWLVDGRSTCVPLDLPRYGAVARTAFMLIDPKRLSNPYGRADERFLRGGIELDRYGAPAAYHIRERNPGDLLMSGTNDYRWERIPAFTRWGRRRFIHAFCQRMAEQSQGRSPFLPVLKKLRMLEKRDDLELQAAANAATFAMFIKSEVPSDALFRMMSEAPTGELSGVSEQLADFMEFQAEYYQRNAYMVNGTKVAHLLPQEEMGSINSDRGGENFVTGQKQWMRQFGWALGMTGEQISGDFTESSYVGIRAGFNEAWKATMADRSVFGDTALTPMVDLWLEEEIATGRIELPAGAPSYEEARAAYLQLRWIGPGRGSVDPGKEAMARKTNMQIGFTTLEQELAEEGIDPEDHLTQLGQEERWREEQEIPSIFPKPGAAAPAAAPEQSGDDDETAPPDQQRPGGQE